MTVAFPAPGIETVVGLIDADMKPLRGPIDPQSGEHRGMAVIERKGGPVVQRTISSAERTTLCGALFVHAWRAAGSRARAMRPRMGQDFNDAVRLDHPGDGRSGSMGGRG